MPANGKEEKQKERIYTEGLSRLDHARVYLEEAMMRQRRSTDRIGV
jgi:hypothetical protein